MPLGHPLSGPLHIEMMDSSIYRYLEATIDTDILIFFLLFLPTYEGLQDVVLRAGSSRVTGLCESTAHPAVCCPLPTLLFITGVDFL